MNKNIWRKGIVGSAIALCLVFAAAFVSFPLPGHIPVLMYHFIGTGEDALREKNFVSRDSFAQQMAFLHLFGYRVISMDDYDAIKTGKRKPRGRELLITFDDGNYTFEKEAFPILARYRFPVTLFVVSESVKRQLHGSMPADTLKRLLATGWIAASSHSKTHPFLSSMTEEQMKKELEESKKDLEEMLGVPIRYFAYPSGDLDERVIGFVQKAGYRLAFTTSHKQLKKIREGPYALTRIKITRSSDNPLIFWFMVSGIYHGAKGVLHQIRF